MTEHPLSDLVAKQYKKWQYPEPIENLENWLANNWDGFDPRHAHRIFWPDRPYQPDIDILSAGCGTNQAPAIAYTNPAAHVVAIDISTESIAHGRYLKDKYGLTNLEFHVLPIEEVSRLNLTFDLVICTGVLHHLSIPDEGLRALRNVLKADGAMHLMVYAPYGRAGIYMIQEYCRRLGIGTTDEEINDLANTLLALPHGHPLARLLGEAPDFRRKAALADALLNPQDRAYSVPQFLELVRSGGLRFGRWLRQAPYLPVCGDLVQTPHASRVAELPLPEQYAALELFRGTMLRHSSICYRDDDSNQKHFVQFKAENWSQYIPHRLPHTIYIEDHPPPGAVGVLVNRGHTYPDIYMPITKEEKRLLDAIDGHRSIAEIMDKAVLQNREQTRAFFQKLWFYDQVVFDMSRRLNSK